MSEANSSNYFSVAVVDTSKAESRKLRIEAAVQRSKTEYTAIHAYTERDVSTGLARLTAECVEGKDCS